MSKMYFKKSQKKSFWERQGFYVAIALCLLAVGASSFIALERLRGDDLTGEGSSIPLSTPAPVDQKVSDVPYSEPEVSSAPSSAAESKEPVSSQPVSKQPEPVSEAAPFFVLPVGGTILKNFDADNLQYSDTFRDWRLHTGLDIAADMGTPVLAAAQGKVQKIHQDALWGTVVVIDHGDGILASYCGLNATPTVKEGDTVEAGRQIGAVDTIPCESVEAAHLHFSVERNGTPISPLELTGEIG